MPDAANRAYPHFGTTIYEDTPSPGAAEDPARASAQVAQTDRFLRVLGAECSQSRPDPAGGWSVTYFWGQRGDPGYRERDVIVWPEERRPLRTATPRLGLLVFRLVHDAARTLYNQLLDERLLAPLESDEVIERFLHGQERALLVVGPEDQPYELAVPADVPAENHAVFVWTDPTRLEETTQAYAHHFGLVPVADGRRDFHGMGEVTMLVCHEPPVSVGLLTPYSGVTLAPGYPETFAAPHFRLGAWDRAGITAQYAVLLGGGRYTSVVRFHGALLEVVDL